MREVHPLFPFPDIVLCVCRSKAGPKSSPEGPVQQASKPPSMHAPFFYRSIKNRTTAAICMNSASAPKALSCRNFLQFLPLKVEGHFSSRNSKNQNRLELDYWDLPKKPRKNKNKQNIPKRSLVRLKKALSEKPDYGRFGTVVFV